ncbi:7356_t:CDS:2 [Rhizophagus irregularis]|nr:7356_t:CDS:2 [Rhizophagus irregularis]
MSGSTSPQHPNLLYSHQLEQYDNNNDNTKNVQVKTEFDYRQFEESVSSVESSPHNVPVNDFEQPSQFTYNYPPPLCDDSSSEPISTATSPTVTTGGDLTFALSPDSLSQYYSIIQSTPLDQNTGVQPSFTDQMRFIIYEPRQNDNVSLLPNINGQNFSSVPMWSLPVSAPSIDNRPITSVASTQAHLRSHSPARPYQCPMCPRSFSRKHDLQRHIRVHTGVKPYQCPCCRKAFARTDALRRHFKMEETCRNSPEVQNMKTRRRYSEMH